PDCARPFAQIGSRKDGAISANGRISGSYLHGMFQNNAFRAAWLKSLGGTSKLDYNTEVESTLDDLADHIETHLDVDGILRVT
ncbi:MAG: cobyric acid synthase, partial [Planktomarina sp.]